MPGRAGADDSTTLSSSWREILTDDLTITRDASGYQLKQIDTELAAFRLAMTTLFPATRLRGPVPTTIVVFRDDGAFNRCRPRDSRGHVQYNVGAYFTMQPEGGRALDSPQRAHAAANMAR